MNEFYKLVDIMKKLRAPDGCPWDREQTIESLKPYLLEETYETLEAMDIGGEELKGELGDLLLNIIFQSLIKEEEGEFTIDDVAKKVSEKLIRRHPHIFADVEVEGTKDVMRNWEEIKKKEKEHRGRKSVLDGIPKIYPPLAKAYKLQVKAAKVGFDWEDEVGALNKLEEELGEMKAAYEKNDRENLKEEIGDVVFTLVNIARKLDIDIVDAVMKTNNKFEDRFRYVEDNCDLGESTLEEMDRLWDEAKNK
ncbi:MULTISPECIES: nucleoside triphosphate pyrophosphohydrolase [Psychrilyobacter]|uniref:Nucleoside triphosphate pyrophosphohydrolase n=1 Tax=Psychrilyobacter piezotolerans TaxID=2293438 RepID=A0ABX9KEM5_9FUSO|nr:MULTISPECIES: nucleoside triphosphate pyrophosphohydrolase [Psychrilyobacter]MCS5420808.1 nucleoside triphosphate pyrophosphohydrolase [Psychrilyobacter sp. S5]NDI78903.1 nucleoside triphosphate pyrophosphohydrolase [Psychrilyobacter piezotolerans]RDE59790.1 nucleoside triphosphate pyrophosphohydrolase [Psychrilyobacter sp. S5]REI40116.1 nucleoside triphosphate pyrophosphohydrolase [Psychrilyobacter piezotolerans]